MTTTASEPARTPETSPGVVLDVRGVDGGYGDQQILHGTTLHVRRQEFVVIVGPNGAGKSTLTKTVVGLLPPWSGEIVFAGTSCANRRPERLARDGLAYVPQIENIFRGLTVDENLLLGAHLAKRRRRELIERVLTLFPSLVRHRKTKAGALSGGERQMVAMARAILLEPQLIVLDEPTAGLSPQMSEIVFDKLVELRAGGVSMLVVEQNVEEALHRCDRAYVLASGETRFEGDGPSLLHDEQLRALYLAG
ncbi:MAG TPA: ABC transporter ATP-binding protein [Nocardioidaceae bacterium]|nr:ABC transporter ATP-binding protein [Nocardioidaceae bacterium]